MTIRDSFSRYLLLARPMRVVTADAVRQVMTRCFRRHGLPRVIRVDNGSPFAGLGALGLSSLSAWWWRLGIQVEFTRRGKPQDNGAHEQMHRVLKAETAQPPAATWAGQVRRLQKFCRYYNEQRPHAGLGERTPSEFYRPNPRAYAVPKPLRYPSTWPTYLVGANGKIYWGGRQRRVGDAFAREWIALKDVAVSRQKPAGEVVEVHWGKQLIGELHLHDHTDVRPAYWKAVSPTA